MGCRSEKVSFCLNRTLPIERTGALQWGGVVAGGGVSRGMTNLGGGGNSWGGDADGGGTTLVGSINAVPRGGVGIGGGCYSSNLSNIRGMAILGIGGIEWGSQLLKSFCSLVIDVSFSW